MEAWSLTIVLFDGARSAEPPINSGRASAIALITFPEAARVAMLPSELSNTGSFSRRSLGSSPLCIRFHSAASSGFFSR